jgi:hypothetical protein
MTSNCAWGSKLYLPDDGKIYFPLVEKKILIKKAAGINPIYFKARWLEEELSEDLKSIDPNNKLLKAHKVYRQQLTSKCLRLCGFKNNGRYSNRPLLVLEW